MGDETSAEDEVLGPYGRRSWLSDHEQSGPGEDPSPWGSAPAPTSPAVAVSELPPPPVVPQASDRVGVPWARRPWDPQPVGAVAGDWWSPGAVNPHPPADAVASTSYHPFFADPIDSSSAWQVVDAGGRITVAAPRPGPLGLVGLVVVVPAAFLLFSGWFGSLGVGAFLVLAGAAVGFQVIGMLRRPRTLLTADGAGLHLRRPGRTREVWAEVPWEHVAQFVSLRPMVSGVETWYVERLDGSRVPVASAPTRSGRQAGELRSIIRGIAIFPIRFDRPPIAVDGVAVGGDGRFAHLPSPPRQNENTF